LATTAGGQDDFATSIALGHTYVASSNTVHSFRASLNRTAVHHEGASFFGPRDVGINAYSYLPRYMILNVNPGFAVGSTQGNNVALFATNVGANDDVTMVRGAHQFAFGGNLTHSLIHGLANIFAVGVYSFSGNTTGLALADFLTGNMSSFQQSAPN